MACYVGRTTNFVKRKYNHQYACNHLRHVSHMYYVYQFIRMHGGFDNWSMIEIEKYPCKDRFEASKQERYWVETLKATLNGTLPGRTRQEYGRKHYKQNRDTICAKNNTKFICECGCRYTYANKSKHTKTQLHQNNINNLQYEYFWEDEDGTPCSKDEYEQNQY